jgi:hypothetical protein
MIGSPLNHPAVMMQPDFRSLKALAHFREIRSLPHKMENSTKPKGYGIVPSVRIRALKRFGRGFRRYLQNREASGLSGIWMKSAALSSRRRKPPFRDMLAARTSFRPNHVA